jgi:hypothetical protein
MTPVPVDPKLTPDRAHHRDCGSPLVPTQGWKWEFDSRTKRFIPSIADGPSRYVEPRLALPKVRHLYAWHPDQGHYSLLRDDDDWEEYENNIYEYDAERVLFKRVTIVYEYDANNDQFVRVAK